MEITEILEEELSFLRQILSNLKLEETAWTTGNQAFAKQLYEERFALRKLSREKRKMRKLYLKKLPLSKDKIEETSLLEQIRTLNAKILDQVQLNRKCKAESLQFTKEEAPKKKKKKPLLLEEEAN
jgi:hypothetical protein